MATKSTQLKKALKIASKVKSKAGVKQNPPQSTSYTKKADKEVPAKAVGYRFTDRFINSATGKALGISAKSKPTAAQIEKYRDKKYSDGSRYIYSEARKDKSDVSYKDKLKKGGATQNPPQSTSYTVENDKGDYAKPVGYRFTDRFINSATGKRLGVDQSSKPTASQIEKYRNKTYSDGTRYIYSEARMDKSDKNYSRRLEDGGYTHMDLMQGDYDTSRKTQNTYLRIKTWRIWNGYTMQQKYHFLHDHGFDMVASEIANGNDVMYQELPKKVQDAFVEHTKMGQYANGGMMARGGHMQGYDDREDERLAMKYGKMANKDFVGSHEAREHSRRDDARFEERMASGGQTAPQSTSYSKRNDRPIMAKPVGWRFTERGANRLGVNPYRKPYAREIEEYGNKKFFNGDSYMDYETRKDKSDIAPKTGLERGGNVNEGLSWRLDRAKHNKSEDYEVPMNKRKREYGGEMKDGGLTRDRKFISKQKWEQTYERKKPASIYKSNWWWFEDGGEMKDGGLTRDRKFISKQKWEQTYERKKPASIYKSNWWWFKNGGEMARGGFVTNIDEAFGSQELKNDLKSKMKPNDPILAFAYTDYGGDFFDKVAIEYFKENYPNNIVSEITYYNGQNGIVFGEPVKQFLEASEDYILGFYGIEQFYYEMLYNQEMEDFETFLNDLEKYDNYEVSKEALPYLMDAKSGYYGMQPNGLDFYSPDLIKELENQDLIKKKDEMARGGKTKGGYTYVPKEFIDSITTSNDVEFDNSEILDGAYVKGRNRKFGDGGEMDDDYARGGRITNSDSFSSVENFLDFQGSNLEGKTLSNGDYVVLSYGWYPLWFYSRRNSTWYGNSTRYSASTSKQSSQSRPTYDAIMLPKDQLEKVMANSSMGIDSKEMGGVEELTK